MLLLQSPTRKMYLAIISALGWFALIAQFYIYITTTSFTLTEKIIRYFSFFTILTNIVVAVCCTTLFLNRSGKAGRCFKQYKTLTAIAVYILVVGIIYNMILRFLWNPQGLQRIVDELLHTIIPLLFLCFWLLFIPKTHLKIRSIFSWLLYPLLYIVFILVRGAFSGYYPYPFINVSEISYGRVLINSVAIAAAFFVLSLGLVTTGNFLSRKN